MTECFTGLWPTAMLSAVPRTRRNELFGQNLRRLREGKKWSQVVLADKVKVKQPDVSGWERGGVPALDKLVRLALALECSIDQLVRGVDRGYDEYRARDVDASATTKPVVKDDALRLAELYDNAMDDEGKQLTIQVAHLSAQAPVARRASAASREASTADGRRSTGGSRARTQKSRVGR